MIVSLHIDNCGGCGKPVMYQREPEVPQGWVFTCVNPTCAFYAQQYMVPTLKALRFYASPKEDAA